MKSEPVYESGTACSGCENGCDEDYPALCKPNDLNASNSTFNQTDESSTVLETEDVEETPSEIDESSADPETEDVEKTPSGTDESSTDPKTEDVEKTPTESKKPDLIIPMNMKYEKMSDFAKKLRRPFLKDYNLKKCHS